MGKDLKGKELGEGIRQRANGVYSARFTDRFGKRKEIYNKDLKQLKIDFNKMKYEDSQCMNVVNDRIILDEWFIKFIDIHKHGIISDNTRQYYKYIYNKYISSYLGKFRLKEITHLQVKELLKTLEQKGLKFETQNKVRIILQDMFNKAQLDNLFIGNNPARGIKLVRNEKFDRKVLSKKEQETFLNCSLGTFYHELFVVMINTGMRVGEITALTKSDIDFETNTISVTKNLLYQRLEGDEKKEFHIGNTKTKSSVRKIPMNQQCREALQKQILKKEIVKKRKIKDIDEEFKDLLFVTKFNTPINDVIVSDAIKRIINEINLSKDNLEQMEYFSSHTFRHTFATNALEAGVPMRVVQEWLGHATMQMTANLYSHVTEEFSQSEIQKIGGVKMGYSIEIGGITP